MMGTKQRDFAPLVKMSLEALVPQDHFYRHLERTLDLSFVREVCKRGLQARGAPPLIRWCSSNYNWSCSSRVFAPNDN
jgi:hypothetical protein